MKNVPKTSLKHGFFSIFLIFFVSSAFIFWVTLLIVKPDPITVYSAQHLSTVTNKTKNDLFYKPQADTGGNTYVWTKAQSSVWFNYQNKTQVQLNFEIRSAAITGGPNLPVKVFANGWFAGELLPDPTNPNFQKISLKFSPPPALVGTPGLQIDLSSSTFQPSTTSDTRVLGTMLKSISLDSTEAWSKIIKRELFFLVCIIISIIITVLYFLTKSPKLFEKPESESSPEKPLYSIFSYSAIFLSFLGSILMLITLLVIPEIDTVGNSGWLTLQWFLSAIYSGLIFVIIGLTFPIGVREPTTLINKIGNTVSYHELSLSTPEDPLKQKKGYFSTFKADTPLIQTLEFIFMPLWVTGLLLIEIYAQQILFGLNNIWPYYFLLGTLFPGTVLILGYIERLWSRLFTIVKLLKFMLAIFGFFGIAYFAIISNAFLTLGIGAFSFVGVFLVQVKFRPFQAFKSPGTIIYFIFGLVISAVAWVVCIRIALKGQLYTPGSETWFETLLTNANLAILGFLIALFGLVFFNLFAEGNPLQKLKITSVRIKFRFKTWGTRIGQLIAFFVLLGGSLRAPSPDTVSFHHWGALVGPASMVRQGGILLWDTPEQYGFLNTLLITYLPAENVYQSFYLVNSLLLTITALILFSILRKIRSGFLNYIFSLLITFAAVFIVPGSANIVYGILVTPAVSSYRFIFPYLLVILVLWETFQNKPDKLQQFRKFFWLGSLCWVVGLLWSAESAIYSTAVWAPAYSLMVFQRSFILYPEWRKRVGFILRWILLLPGLVLLAIFSISVIYLLVFKLFPDWSLFFQYATLFQGGYNRALFYPNGTVAVLVFTLGIITTAGGLWLHRDGIFSPYMKICLALFGMVWSTASYYVGRSVEINAVSLIPIIITALAVLLYLITKDQQKATWQLWLKLAIFPLFVVLLFIPIFIIQADNKQMEHLVSFYDPNIVPNITMDTDPELFQLMLTANVRADDPIVFIGDRFTLKQPSTLESLNSYEITPKLWVPIDPHSLILPLPDDKLNIYINRFVNRVQTGGWLIEPISAKSQGNGLQYGVGLIPPFREPQLFANRFTPTKSFENTDWRITWFELKK